MTWIKICGITNLEDALVAVDAGADALGFVFYEKSPRNVSRQQAREIIASFSREIEVVGVFVNNSAEQIGRIAADVGLTGAQTYFDPAHPENIALLNDGSLARYIALPLGSLMDDSLFEGSKYTGFSIKPRTEESMQSTTAVFLDSGSLAQPGGTGRTFDWSAAAPLAKMIKTSGWNYVVAGGLTPENVADAISILHPWGVDVSSGVEARPGKKDPEKVRAFIKAVRAADKTNSRN